MFGQPGPLQISTAVVNGSDIVTPPKSYMTLFIRENGDSHEFWCKDSDGDVEQVMAGQTPVTCGINIG